MKVIVEFDPVVDVAPEVLLRRVATACALMFAIGEGDSVATDDGVSITYEEAREIGRALFPRGPGAEAGRADGPGATPPAQGERRRRRSDSDPPL